MRVTCVTGVTAKEAAPRADGRLGRDRARLDRIPDAWAGALAAAREAGFSREIGREGSLLAPDALARAAPSPGPYRCRIIRLGAPYPRRPYESFNPWFCYVTVEGEQF